MDREKSSPMGLYTIGIAALFLLGFLLLVVFAAGTYRDTVTGQAENNQNRALRSYLAVCTRSASEGDVSVAESEYGQMLMIRENGSRYGLKIFRDEEGLKEFYGVLDAEVPAEDAQFIAKTKTFSVERLSDDALAVTTDAGRTVLHLGGPGGGQDEAGGDGR